MKLSLTMLILVSFVYCISAAEIFQDITYTVQGRVTFTKDIPITVTCLTKEEFEEELPAQYFYVHSPTKADLKKEYIDFIISDIPEGDFILFAFQDKNENDKLDKIIMVPKEYWHIYGLERPTTGKPDFQNLAIHINKNFSNLDMNLRKGF
ncbi:MAG: DUF2141 domain-containing protein [Candidatus Cloacimonetes bacterium]|nr:DUF2141 domain-containing protein [Candidatus Cloacimonadota bacterium]